MKPKKPDFGVLARYMAGSCTDQEREEIELWKILDDENERMLTEFKRVWDVTQGEEVMKEDWTKIEQDWMQVKERAGLTDEATSEYRKKIDSGLPVKGTVAQHILKIAAIFVLMALMGVLAYQNWYEPEPVAQSPVLREISTNNGQRVNLTLSDDTYILVNSGSEVKLPNTFQPPKREVYLEGEAYFEVADNPDSPFVIHSQGTTTEVLGTSFAVRSYPEDEQVRVVVEEGRVSFGSKADSETERLVLTENEMGSYNFSDKKLTAQPVSDLDLYMGWKDGYFKFQERPMQDVAKELERQYDIAIIFKNEAIKEMKLTADLKSRSMNNVLDVIAMSLDISYRVENESEVHLSNM